MLGKVVPCDGVGLATNSENSLNSDVHDHETLGTESIRKNFESVGNKQTRPSERIADTEEPDEWNLSVAGCGVAVAGVLVDGAGNGPADETDDHTSGGAEEERTTTDFVDQGSCVDGNEKSQDALTTGKLNNMLVRILT